jgi:hypothetical protein
MRGQRGNLADEWPPLHSLAELALHKWHVKLTCPRCGHQRVMSGAGLWWLFERKRWNNGITEARRRLYCSYCRCADRSKVMPRIDKTNDAPTGALLPDPPIYEWKKLVARYRS